MDAGYSKQFKKILQKIRMPSGQCQACLSNKSVDKDFMITCTLCQSSIHIKHYGRQIDQSNSGTTYDRWKCERCRTLVDLEVEGQSKYGQMDKMQCEFCPSTRGILKRVIYNGTQTIWLHPECSTWPFPIIFQKNNRRIQYGCEFPQRPTGKFWVNLSQQDSSSCQICKKKQGYKIKCMYYTCQKYYHCSCAKTVGIIRDLQSMLFQNGNTYIPPYCQEHLEMRIVDCGSKASKYRNMGDQGKASSFTQMMGAYQVQLNNLKKSAQKHREEEEIRKQMEYQTGVKDELVEELSFDENQQSFKSNHPSPFLQYIFDGEYPKQTSADPKKKPSFLFGNLSEHTVPILAGMEAENAMVAEEDRPPNEGELYIKLLDQNRRISQRESDPSESQWQNSRQFDEEDE